MKKLMIVFATALLVSILAAACQQSAAGLSALNKQDPNLQQEEAPITQEALWPRTPVYKRLRFCNSKPGYTGAFPSEGICLRGRVYAQIANSSGLYTRLPENRYSASTIGSDCSFTISRNCEVSK